MKKTTIKNLTISDFGGIAQYHIDFDENYNSIEAENGSGKSTIIKAVKWLFDLNVSDFYPTKNGMEIQNLTPCVSAELQIDNISFILKKEWITKYANNGETNEKAKKSATAKYNIDGIDLTKKAYQDRLTSLFGLSSFDFLERIADKDFFNTDTTKWKWSDRRKFLLEMSGVSNINNIILNNTHKYDIIKDLILKGNATSDIQSTLRKEKISYKKQQEINLALIHQKEIELTPLSAIDFDKKEKELAKKQKELDKLVSATKKETMSEELKKLQNELFAKQKELTRLSTVDINELSNLRNKKFNLYTDLQNLLTTINKNEQELALSELGDNPVCHFCHQPLPKILAEEITKHTTELSEKINSDKETYRDLKKQYDTISQEIDNHQEPQTITELRDNIKTLENTLKTAKQATLSTLSNEREITLKTDIKALTIDLSKREILSEGKKLIDGWNYDNATIGDKFVLAEQKENVLKDFVKEQCDLIENTVNKFFGNGITFSLFEIVNNNGEPKIAETCEVVWNNKIYSSMSTGEKLFVNIKITEKIQDYFKSKFFLLIDNAESITRKIDSNRQLICFSAKKNAKLDCKKIEDIY